MNLLLDSALKASLILGVALGATVFLRERSASLRHWVLAVAVWCALVAPLLGLIVPAWQINTGALSTPSPQRATSPGPNDATASEGSVAVETAVSSTPPSGVPPIARMAEVARVAGSIWLAGATLSLLVLAVGMARLARLASGAEQIAAGPAHALAKAISTSWGLRRPVRLLQTEHPSLLVAWGLFRPRVLLPATSQGWTEDRMRVVISHELAHIQRGDWAVQIAAELLRSVYWFNPLVWVACRRLRLESEHACDDAVLNGGVAGAEYAQHLLDLARLLNASRRALLPDLPAPAMARSSSLEGRINAMLNARLNRSPVSRPARTLTIAALLALTIPLAGFAQATFYTLSGSVLDPTNRFLPGATLVLSNAARQSKHEVKSDATGHFEFVGLPSGEYALEAKQLGFAPYKANVAVVGRNLTRAISMEVGSLEETISIASRAGEKVAAPQVRRAAPSKSQVAPAECAAVPVGGVGGKIRPPTKLTDIRPVYPEHLSSTGVGGTVVMDALIGTDGNVRDVTTISAPQQKA